MQAYTIAVDPVRKTDAPKPYRYLAIAAWTSAARKTAGAGDWEITTTGGGVLKADLVADFRCSYDFDNQAERNELFEKSWKRRDNGRLVPVELAASEAYAGVEWVRERYTRDESAELTECVERFMAVAATKGWTGSKMGTVLNLQVSGNDDDAHETDAGSGFTASGANVTMSANFSAASRYNGGHRFAAVTVPAGATIDSCVLQIKPESTTADDAKIYIYFEDVDDAADFATTADVTSRALTASSVFWESSGLGTSFVSSPDITAPAANVFEDRGGWASGQDVCVICQGSDAAAAGKTLRSVSHDTDSAGAAKLDITYTAGGGGAGPPTRTLLGVGT